VVTKVLEEPTAPIFSVKVELGCRNSGGIRLRKRKNPSNWNQGWGGNRKGQHKWLMNM
jgi:hypothetical protein